MVKISSLIFGLYVAWIISVLSFQCKCTQDEDFQCTNDFHNDCETFSIMEYPDDKLLQKISTEICEMKKMFLEIEKEKDEKIKSQQQEINALTEELRVIKDSNHLIKTEVSQLKGENDIFVASQYSVLLKINHATTGIIVSCAGCLTDEGVLTSRRCLLDNNIFVDLLSVSLVLDPKASTHFNPSSIFSFPFDDKKSDIALLKFEALLGQSQLQVAKEPAVIGQWMRGVLGSGRSSVELIEGRVTRSFKGRKESNNLNGGYGSAGTCLLSNGKVFGVYRGELGMITSDKQNEIFNMVKGLGSGLKNLIKNSYKKVEKLVTKDDIDDSNDEEMVSLKEVKRMEYEKERNEKGFVDASLIFEDNFSKVVGKWDHID